MGIRLHNRNFIERAARLLLVGIVAVTTAEIEGWADLWDVSVWISTQNGSKTLNRETDLKWEAPCDCNMPIIRIDTEKRYQAILGLGSSWDHATCENLFRLPEPARNEAIKRIVHPEEGIGMNLMRLCIGSSDFIGEEYYTYDDLPQGETDPDLIRFSIEKDRAYLLPVIKKSLEYNPDLLFFASPWSPPAWMKTSGVLGGGKLKPEYYATYAHYLVRYIQTYAAEGVPIYAITVQNEPHMAHKDYPTTLWTGEEQRDFIRGHLGPVFKEQGITTRIWCWDHNWNTIAFPRTVLSDPETAQYVGGTAFHLYEGQVDAQSVLKQEFPGKDIYFSEGSVFGTAGAAKLIGILQNWSRSYSAWVTMLDEHRKPNRGPHHASATCMELKDDLSIEYRFDYYMYGHFMKFIQRGAFRLKSEMPENKGVTPIAFRNPEDGIVLIVVNSARQAKRFLVECCERMFRVEQPANSVATYLWVP